MTDQQLRALLRLKRYEQPPAGYFDQLLKDVHCRQRSELLRKSLWQIAWERVHTFFGEHSMGSLSYAGAMSAMLIVGLAAIGVIGPRESQNGSQASLQASLQAGSNPPTAPTLAQVADPADNPLSLQPMEPGFSALTQSPELAPPSRSRLVQAPRYVIDARPASYEPSFNF